MESPLIDNYAAFMPIVAAFSGALGRTLADARAELERRVLDRAAHTLSTWHDFSNDVANLIHGIECVEETRQRESLLDTAKALSSKVDVIRRPDDRDTVSEANIWETFSACVRQVQLQFGVMDKARDDLFYLTLDGRITQCLITVFSNVLRNVNRHSDAAAFDSSGRAVPRVRFGTIDLEGTRQAVIVLESHARSFLDDHYCKNLYRYPVEGPRGELRLGAYIAGLNARRIGARIHACVLDDRQIFRTTIIVPVEALI